MRKLVDDDTFLDLWKIHKSASKIASILKCDIRNVYLRRRNLESRLGMALNSDGKLSKFYKHLSPREHKQRLDLGIENGTVVVFSDAHFQLNVRTPANAALLMVIEALKPKAVINGGDAFDGASISRYPRINWDSRPGVREELQACTDRLEEIEEVSGGAKLVWCLGNHDQRYEIRLAATAPEFQGVKNFSLKDHFPAWKPCWSVWLNDSTVVKHRYKGGIHATHNNTLWSGKNIVTGHLHSLRVTPFNDYGEHTRYGVDSGTLADPKGPQFMDYLEESPTNWRSGFVVLNFHKGQLLWPEIVKVHSGNKVEFRGSVFEV